MEKRRLISLRSVLLQYLVRTALACLLFAALMQTAGMVIGQGQTAAQGSFGAMLLREDAGGYVLVAVTVFAIGFSAMFQGKVAAASADALGATGKGTANYFVVIGVAETVAVFALVFCMLLLNTATIA